MLVPAYTQRLLVELFEHTTAVVLGCWPAVALAGNNTAGLRWHLQEFWMQMAEHEHAS